MISYSIDREELARELNSSPVAGLTAQLAAERLLSHGPNILTEKKKKTFPQRFFEQMKDYMVIILIVAAVLSAVFTVINNENDWIEPIVIIAIVILNALLGVTQESKAEAALEALKSMASPSAKVLRDGIVTVIGSSDIVPGDVVLLEAGDYIPADGRLVDSASLRCDESPLTGESLPVEKDYTAEVNDIVSLGDRNNMVYSGCSVSYGRGKMMVTETGMSTEMGKIATLLAGEKTVITPMQKKLAQLGKTLGTIALAICAFIFVFGIIMQQELAEMFMTAVSLAVAAIPEGLPAIVTIVLAVGVSRMVRKNAIIRRLPAVETLGSATVICSDKTGTLTQNRMTLVKLYSNGQTMDLTEELPDESILLLKLSVLCNDGRVEETGGEIKHIGDPTETALVAGAMKYGIDKSVLEANHPRMAELPFDSDRKLMTTVNFFDEKYVVTVKGAPDILLSRCTSGNIEAARAANSALGEQALRVLAVAYKELDSIPANPTFESLESDLKFVGLVGMIDPPRPEVIDAVETCKRAGIRTVMITGDHIATASAIARELGILSEGDVALSGAELAKLSDEELERDIRKYSVYARVSPEDKIRIVKAWQKAGDVVAMTGDGVNDAPALKAADIGCAMGITGTDVAKGAADMILTDDNFATIVTAVKEGRGIYDNIRKAVNFLLSCNLGEIIAVFFCMLIWNGPPLLAIQLLWMNLVTDSLPALALGMEPVEKGIMNQKPHKKNESVLSGGLGITAGFQGVMFGVITLVAYWFGRFHIGGDNVIMGQTMAFAVLSLSQLFHAFNARSPRSIFKVGLFSNLYMIGAFLISASIMMAVLLIPPLQTLFKLTPLPFEEWEWVIGLSISPVIIVELVKLFNSIRAKFKKKQAAITE